MRLAVLLAWPIALAGCATMNETRTERVVSREFRGTKLERLPELEQVDVALRVDGNKLRVTVRRAETCLVSAMEVKQVDASIAVAPGGLGFFAELLCVGAAVPVAALYLPKRDDGSDPLALGSSGRGIGVAAAAGAAVCAGAAIYDVVRAKSRDERVAVEVPLAPTPAPCGTRPAASASVVLRGEDGSARTELTDERGEAAFEAPFRGTVEATVDGRTARHAAPPEARLI